MKYIKWQDELESYLYSLSREEKNKAFSYFSEMYADKREAGLSEEEIVDSFGPPYDVAKRILSESGQPTDDFFDGAPPEAFLPRDEQVGRERHDRGYPERDYSASAEAVAPPKKNRGFWHLLGGIILAYILLSLSSLLILIPIWMITGGFITIASAVTAMFSGGCSGAEFAVAIGGGMMLVGGSLIVLAPGCHLVVFMWKKFKGWF